MKWDVSGLIPKGIQCLITIGKVVVSCVALVHLQKICMKLVMSVDTCCIPINQKFVFVICWNHANFVVEVKFPSPNHIWQMFYRSANPHFLKKSHCVWFQFLRLWRMYIYIFDTHLTSFIGWHKESVDRAGRVTLQFVDFFHNLFTQCFHWNTHWSLRFRPTSMCSCYYLWEFLIQRYLPWSFYFLFRLVRKHWEHHWPGVMLIWGRKDEDKFLIMKKYLELRKFGQFVRLWLMLEPLTRCVGWMVLKYLYCCYKICTRFKKKKNPVETQSQFLMLCGWGNRSR